MKECILPFPKKGDLGLAKNYWGISLTSIAAKIISAPQRNRIEPKTDNILRKNQNGFRRNKSMTSRILTTPRILEYVRTNNYRQPYYLSMGCPRGVMVKAMNCGIVVREFVLQSCDYVHFRANTLGKGMNPLILPPAMGK